MRALAYKAGVRVTERNQALDHIENCILDTQDELGYPAVCVVTSINDGGHSRNPPSRHYSDEAEDLRTKNRRGPDRRVGDMGTLKQKQAFARVLGEKLGSRFYVKLEKVGTPNEHIHAQVRKGASYP